MVPITSFYIFWLVVAWKHKHNLTSTYDRTEWCSVLLAIRMRQCYIMGCWTDCDRSILVRPKYWQILTTQVLRHDSIYMVCRGAICTNAYRYIKYALSHRYLQRYKIHIVVIVASLIKETLNMHRGRCIIPYRDINYVSWCFGCDGGTDKLGWSGHGNVGSCFCNRYFANIVHIFYAAAHKTISFLTIVDYTGVTVNNI